MIFEILAEYYEAHCEKVKWRNDSCSSNFCEEWRGSRINQGAENPGTAK